MEAAHEPDPLRVAVGGRPPYLDAAVATSPALRRDLQLAIRLGISPRRLAGWEPTTTHTLNEQGQIATTTPEPEWGELDIALLDALTAWEAGLYSCGHHRDESAQGMVHQPGYHECKACKALGEAQTKQHKRDEPDRKAGRNPDYPRRWFVRVLTVAQAMAERAGSNRD